MKDKTDHMLDRLAICILTGVAVFAGLFIASFMGYFIIKLCGIWYALGISIFAWAFIRIVPGQGGYGM